MKAAAVCKDCATDPAAEGAMFRDEARGFGPRSNGQAVAQNSVLVALAYDRQRKLHLYFQCEKEISKISAWHYGQ